MVIWYYNQCSFVTICLHCNIDIDSTIVYIRSVDNIGRNIDINKINLYDIKLAS